MVDFADPRGTWETAAQKGIFGCIIAFKKDYLSRMELESEVT
jgi:hypothetical protein